MTRATLVTSPMLATAVVPPQPLATEPVGDTISRNWNRPRVRCTLTPMNEKPATSSPEQPYAAELDAERDGWYELVDLVRSLTPQECLLAGYYRDPDWSVRDVAGHVGTWLAEAETQLEQIAVGTYEGHDIDIDGLNASFLAAMRDQPWEVAWIQANAGRTRMIQAWSALREPSDEAAWWIRKAGPEHYGEHVPRLRDWVAELISRRE
jgi:hypothetical protein